MAKVQKALLMQKFRFMKASVYVDYRWLEMLSEEELNDLRQQLVDEGNLDSTHYYYDIAISRANNMLDNLCKEAND